MKNIRHTYLSLIAGLLVFNIQSLSAVIYPVVISEVFYDSPLEESHHSAPHNNGEFIEFFNPTFNNIDISGWKITDDGYLGAGTYYIFPENTIIKSRTNIIVAYQYLNSNFKLTDLFPEIYNYTSYNVVDKSILYQSKMRLMNDGEIISLFDKDGHLVDRMSYRYAKRKIELNSSIIWGIRAHNGTKKYHNELVSIQRINIHNGIDKIIPLEEDYKVDFPTPLKENNQNTELPYLDNLYPDEELNTSDEVGILPGNVNVSPTGAATYTIPIDVPPGTNGIQPNLSIVYNSQAGQGSLGLRWDISGISSITRVPQNFYLDAKNGKVEDTSINFDNRDRINLDGQRLILINEKDNLTNGAVYATEQENYNRITTAVNSEGDIYFILKTKDGQTMEYGKTVDSRVMSAYREHRGSPQEDFRVIGWKLNKYTDINGSSIEYSYTCDGQYISQINYTQNQNIVNFEYQSNTRNSQAKWVKDFLVVNDKILDKIYVKNNNSLIRTYSFTYIPSDVDFRLNAIDLISSDNKKINSTKINWGEDGIIKKVSLGEMSDKGLNESDDSHLYSADVDGDGKTDRIELWEGSKTEQGHFRVIFAHNNVSENIYFDHSYLWDFHPMIQCVDADNNGEVEIYLFLQYGLFRKYVYNDRINKIEMLGEYKIPNNDYYMKYYPLFINVNNDKYIDLLLVPNYSSSTIGEYINTDIWVYYGTNNGLSSTGNVLCKSHHKSNNTKDISTFDSNTKPRYAPTTSCDIFGNFNSDNKLDIIKIDRDPDWTFNVDYSGVHMESSTQLGDFLYTKKYFPTRSSPSFDALKTIDINNDGREDIIVQFNEKRDYDLHVYKKNHWYEIINTGKSPEFDTFFSRRDLPFHGSSRANSEERQDFYVIDYDGDGWQDVIVADETTNKNFKGSIYYTTTWYFYKNKKGSFSLERTLADESQSRLSKMNTVQMDINGDGIADLVFGETTTDNKGRYSAFTKYRAGERLLVEKITDGLGKSVNFAYKNYVYPNPYLNPSSNPENILDYKEPIQVVASCMNIDGTLTGYDYQEPKLSKDRGFLGFKRVKSINGTTRLEIETNYEIDTINYKLDFKSQKTSVNSTIISTTTNTNETRNTNITQGKNNEKRYVSLVSSSVSTDNLTGITKTTNVLSVDEYYNITKQEIIIGSSSKIIESEYETRKNQTVKYLPQYVKTTQKRNGQNDITETTSYEYWDDERGLLKNQIAYANTNMPITSYFEYYPTGNLKLEKTTAQDCKPQSKEYLYDNDVYFRFPNKIKNTLGQIAEKTYNYATGNILSEKDFRKQTTTYVYDGFGNLSKEIHPNGEIISYNTKWAVFDNKLYYKEISSDKILGYTKVYYDKYGREVYSEETGWEGKLITSSKKYNELGQLEEVTKPHYAEEVVLYSKYVYDAYGRKTSESIFDGKDILTTSYMYDGKTTTVKTPDGKNFITVIDNTGLTTSKTDPGGTITYIYNAAGKPLNINTGGRDTKIEYNDAQGNQTSLIDPDAGTIKYEYFANGQLKKQTNANKDVIELIYDDYGRLDTKTVSDFGIDELLGVSTTKYNYVGAGKDGEGQIESIEMKKDGLLEHKRIFSYNPLHQMISQKDEYDGKVFISDYTYDPLWRISTEKTPSGVTTTNIYNTYGDLYRIKFGDKVIWEGNEQNSNGKFTDYTLGNGLKTTKKYYDFGGVKEIKTFDENNSIVQNDFYEYYSTNYNLHTRNDLVKGRLETFTYDDLDRLTKGEVLKNGQNELMFEMNYHDNGNIDTKSDVGTYQYTSAKPHAMTNLITSLTNQAVSDDKQFIDYTTFNKISKIRQGIDENYITKQYNIYYGLDEERIKTVYTENGNIKYMRYYMGNYEMTVNDNNTIDQVDYITTPAGLICIVKYNDAEGIQRLYYVHQDNMGSIQQITDESRNIISSYYYTAWGGRELISGTDITDRGYTFHEHLTEFGLINMNGRVYDPVLARFLSPDAYIQAPDYSQGFNRFAYCLNNPFKYTDPSGEIFGIDDGIIIAAAIGAAIGAASYTANVAFSDGGFDNWNWKKFWTSTAFGAVSGVATAGIGSAFGSVGGTGTFWGDIVKEGARAFGHGWVGGVTSLINGGDFIQGFASGGLGSLGGSAFVGVAGQKFAGSLIGTVGFSALSGGVGAELTGGDFWKGAGQGAIVGLLNHGGEIVKKIILDSEVIIMEDTEGAGDKGHMAIAGGNNKRGWEYAAKYAEMVQNADGTTEMVDGNLLVGSKSLAVSKHYDTLRELKAANPEYDRFISLKTTYTNAMRAVNVTYSAALGRYHFMFANCAQAVAKGLRASGIYDGSSIYPNERFDQINKHYYP